MKFYVSTGRLIKILKNIPRHVTSLLFFFFKILKFYDSTCRLIEISKNMFWYVDARTLRVLDIKGMYTLILKSFWICTRVVLSCLLNIRWGIKNVRWVIKGARDSITIFNNKHITEQRILVLFETCGNVSPVIAKQWAFQYIKAHRASPSGVVFKWYFFWNFEILKNTLFVLLEFWNFMRQHVGILKHYSKPIFLIKKWVPRVVF